MIASQLNAGAIGAGKSTQRRCSKAAKILPPPLPQLLGVMSTVQVMTASHLRNRSAQFLHRSSSK
jgi:hypothetical protein